MTLSGSLQAFKAAANKKLGRTASEDTIAYRLETCSSCPRLKKAETKEERASLILAGEQPEGVRDMVCSVCGCSIALLTSARPQDIHHDSPEERAQRPPFCWLHAFPIS